MQDYLQGLNAQQREAVLHRDGPLMIVAGAGSGKTKVLTTRIAHLMATGVDAFNILALTFTNKAAKEMKKRIEKVLGNSNARMLKASTPVAIKCAMRVVSTFVFPLPAPATIINGPSLCKTASRCCAFNPCK